MSYQWNKFGRLIDVALGDKYIILTNENNEYRKMARYAYKENALVIHDNAKKLIGLNVSLRTSQNTANWPPEIWFSDVKKL